MLKAPFLTRRPFGCLMQDASRAESTSSGVVDRWNVDEPIEVGSGSSPDSAVRSVTEQSFAGQLGNPRTPPDLENPLGANTLADFWTQSYSRTPLSVNSSFEMASPLDENRSRVCSSAVSHGRCFSGTSHITVPAASPTSELSGSAETSDEHSGRNLDCSPTSPSAVFRRSLKTRILERAGILIDDPPQTARQRGEMESQTVSQQPPGMYADSSEQRSHHVLWPSQTTGDGAPASQSPADRHRDLSEPLYAASRLPGVDKSSGLYLPGTRSTQAETSTRFPAVSSSSGDVLWQTQTSLDHEDLIDPSNQPTASTSPPTAQYLAESSRTFPYLLSALVSPSSVTRTLYPGVCRPGLSYHEAAALFYNQLAAVHRLQRQQQSGAGAQPRL